MKTLDKAPHFFRFSRALENDPTSKAFAPLAELYRKSQLYDDAYRILKQGLAHHPQYGPGLICLAHCHYDTGKYVKARKIIAALLEDYQDNLKLIHLAVQVYNQEGNYKKALFYANRYLCLDRNHPEIKELRRKLLVQLKRRKEEVLPPKELPREHQDYLNESYWLTVDLTKENYLPVDKMPEEMQKSSREEIKTLTLANLYYKQGHLQKSIDILEELMDENPASNEVYEKLNQVIAERNGSGKVPREGDLAVQKYQKYQNYLNQYVSSLKDKGDKDV